MSVPVGGLRSRLIFDSTFNVIKDGLTALGWMSSGRRHVPITFESEAQETEQEVPLNTLALSDENVDSTVIEMGSQLSDNTRYFYVDFFAEDDAIGKHLIGDVRDILQGRMPSIGRNDPGIHVLDYRQATPTEVTYCIVENVKVDRAHGWNRPWLRHWFSIQFMLIDTYDNDGSAPPPSYPSSILYPGG